MNDRTLIQIVQHLQPDGLGHQVMSMHQQLSEHWDCHIISLEGDAEQIRQAWPALRTQAGQLHCLGKSGLFSPLALYRLIRLISHLQPEVVHTHHATSLLYGGLASWFCSASRLIHTEHDAWHLDHRQTRQMTQHLLNWFRPTLVADADAIADELRLKLPHSQPRVITNGIDTQRFCPGSQGAARQQLGLPLLTPIIGCAGRLDRHKGHRYLLQALQHLPNDVHLALVGSGPEEATLRETALELGLERRVHFLGYVEQMPCFYQAIDVFCLPSLAEGRPLTPLEAQACNKPVVLTDVGGCRQCLAPGGGQLVPAHNTQALCRALQEELESHQVANPRHYVLSRASLHHTIAAYNALYQA